MSGPIKLATIIGLLYDIKTNLKPRMSCEESHMEYSAYSSGYIKITQTYLLTLRAFLKHRDQRIYFFSAGSEGNGGCSRGINNLF